MPLLLQREIGDQTQLAVWKIEEPANWFREQLMLDDKENAVIDSIRHPQRKLHWLSSRLLIRKLMNVQEFIHLESDENGKPVIRNFPVNISLSHSFDLSALLLSHKFEVGIDIEKVDVKVERIKNKFLSPEELNSILKDQRLEQLYVFWCAKEAMYKWYGKRQLEFREHLFVNPFHLSSKGIITGMVRKSVFKKELKIFYEELDGYMMAYTIGN